MGEESDPERPDLGSAKKREQRTAGDTPAGEFVQQVPSVTAPEIDGDARMGCELLIGQRFGEQPPTVCVYGMALTDAG